MMISEIQEGCVTDSKIESISGSGNNYYSSTCHGRPPLVQRKSGLSWQVAPRDRERTYAPLCQIKHTHQTAYISQQMHNIISTAVNYNAVYSER